MTYPLQSHWVYLYRVYNCDLEVGLVGRIVSRTTRQEMFQEAARTLAVGILLVDSRFMTAKALI